MHGFHVPVNIFQGANRLIEQIIVPVVARSAFTALNQAETFVNGTLEKTQWALASFVFPNFPSGPTAVAA